MTGSLVDPNMDTDYRSEHESDDCLGTCLALCCGCCCCFSFVNLSNPWCLQRACGGARKFDDDERSIEYPPEDDKNDKAQGAKSPTQHNESVNAQPGPQSAMSSQA